MSTYQLAIALLFNETMTLSGEVIAKSTNLPAKELDRNLNSLEEYKILKKTEKDGVVSILSVFIYFVSRVHLHMRGVKSYQCSVCVKSIPYDN